ncbi:MAG: phosphosulfolactate synthase [Candidatus Lambdaproteobacteria bacterium]|nr:phosphosulfolactate synthase [Candidatus Lambdaproteobacteria bacterium]
MTKRALDFIPVPERGGKPRKSGFTLARDYGIGYRQAQDWVEAVGPYLDYIKIRHLYTLLAPLDPQDLTLRKIKLYTDNAIDVNPGGIVFELAWLANKVEPCFETLRKMGFTAVECSENMIPLPLQDKLTAIRLAKKHGLKVMFEVGEKYPAGMLDIELATRDIAAMRDAGADLVILEKSVIEMCLGQKGEKPEAAWLVQLTERVGAEFIVFEAEAVAHHAWLVKHFGPDVNLGPNLEPEYIAKLEATRRTLSREGGYSFLSDRVKALLPRP